MNDDHNLLRDRLISLAGPAPQYEDGARVLETSKTFDQRTAFEQEVSETSLPRLLTFRNEAGAQLTFAAAAGRLLSLVATNFPETSDFEMPVLLSPQDTEAVSLASVLLNRLIAQTTKLTVSTEISSKEMSAQALGVKPELLSPRAQTERTGISDFDQLLTLIQATGSAWIVLRAGHIDEVEGTDDHKTRLQELAETLDPSDQSEEPGLRCVFLTTQDSSETILYASDDGALAFAIMPQTAQAAVLDGWKALARAA